MNSSKIIGRLAQDPKIRYTQTGKAVASINVAVSRGPAKEGKQEMTDFIPVVIWGKDAELVGNTLNKGSRVFVEGRLQVRSYDASDGQKRRVTEIVASFIGTALDGQKSPSPFDEMGQTVDEDIPF